jgi:hypothetical protein
MLLTRLKNIFAAFGADVRRWPKPGRGIWRPLAGSSWLGAERTEAEHIDQMLDLWRIEAPPERLAQNICQQALALRQNPAIPPAVPADVVFWPFSKYWPGVATFGVALALGCLLGWYGGVTPSSTSEDWLNMTALNTLPEDFNER